MVANCLATARQTKRAAARRWWLPAAAVAWLAAGSVTPALAQQDDEPPGFWSRVGGTLPAGLSTKDTEGFWAQTVDGLGKTWSTGRSDLFVPGYIWHMPWQYSEEQRTRYNNVAWGLGYGRTTLDSAGRPRTLFAIVSADSYDHLQYQAGYAWRAKWKPGGRALSFGAGYTVLVIGRYDKLSYAPMPIALPLGSIGIGRFELFGAYVPGFEVGYFFTKFGVH